MKYKGLITLGVIAIAQIFQPDRTVELNDPKHDLIAMTYPAKEVEDLLHSACYNCHSAQSTYPWYSYITPVNFWLQHHVNEGREEFYMSAWGGHKAKWQRHKAEEAVEMLREGEMPLPSYTWMHPEAKLTEGQRTLLSEYFNGLKNAIPDQGKGEELVVAANATRPEPLVARAPGLLLYSLGQSHQRADGLLSWK